MSGFSPERRDGFGLHPQIGRRYEHADLTAHRYKNRRARRRTLLVEKAVRAVTRLYMRELDIQFETFEAFAREVARRLRTEVRSEWTLEEAERRALWIAERLFEELGMEDGTDDTGTPDGRTDGPAAGPLSLE